MTNKNHRDVRDFKSIEKELASWVKKDKGILIVDTGALIDLQRRSERSILPCCGRNIEKYLNGLESLADVIVTPATYLEIQKHALVKLNKYTSELSSAALGRSLGYNEKFKELYSQLRVQERDVNALDNWLLIKNHIEHLLNEADVYESVSPTDTEIIYQAANFSRTIIANEKEPRKTIVLTSDHNHVARGINMLSQIPEFARIKLLDTRK